ncbi:MAG: phenylalanine--tRNA ligase subunit alpha [Candidatus Bathyarchaeota archaeon]|nr:phenylalanine--tRNA ligase subunit alpha [Candidatus Bathyarchaeota archaeon]
MIELRRHERKTLLAVKRLGGKATLEQIISESGLSNATIMRAALVLKEKKLMKIKERKRTIAKLNEEGKLYAEKQLPERRILDMLYDKGGETLIFNIPQEVDIPPDVIPVALGWLVQKNWAVINKEKSTISLSQYSLTQKPPEDDDEKLLAFLAERDTVVVEELDKSLQQAVNILKRRKLIETKERSIYELELTREGFKLIEKGLEVAEEVSQLTPELIITKKWRETKLRKFNVTAPGPTVYPGKVHPLQQIIQRAREIFLEMGFTEIRGPLVETAFWNFDALFQPQDHPAREMMDTFYLANPKAGKLLSKSIVDAVARVHENGWITGSKGWGYKWNYEEAKRLVLRTHTTAETIKYLSQHKKPPIKVFSVDRVYRNEQITYKNIAEFHQIEGIVVGKNVTLRDLMGTLKTFYTKFGLKKTEFWPCYFPYTEPSAQAMVYHPKLKSWIELCGMGMFRPEVLAPLGIKYPVLAWGGGLERLAMIELGLDDIRLLYGNRLEWIRRTSLCQ